MTKKISLDDATRQLKNVELELQKLSSEKNTLEGSINTLQTQILTELNVSTIEEARDVLNCQKAELENLTIEIENIMNEIDKLNEQN